MLVAGRSLKALSASLSNDLWDPDARHWLRLMEEMQLRSTLAPERLECIPYVCVRVREQSEVTDDTWYDYRDSGNTQ